MSVEEREGEEDEGVRKSGRKSLKERRMALV